jgi:hypothetical protein
MSIYTDMIAEIEKRGSCRGDLVNPYGCVCLIGAYAYAKGMDPKSPGFNLNWPYNLAAKELVELKRVIIEAQPTLASLNEGSTVIWKWNDRYARGEEEQMIAMLKAADEVK